MQAKSETKTQTQTRAPMPSTDPFFSRASGSSGRSCSAGFAGFKWPIGLLALLAAQGCVHAEVAVVSQHTALERQAAGEYPERERELVG